MIKVKTTDTATSLCVQRRETDGVYFEYILPKERTFPCPVVLTHGMGENPSLIWHKWFEEIAESGFAVFAHYLPGYGSRNPLGENRPITLRSHITATEIILDEARRLANNDDACLIGHSMGALVNAHVASRNTGGVKALVCLGSAAPPGILLCGPILGRIWKYVPAMLRGNRVQFTRKDLLELFLNNFTPDEACRVADKFTDESGVVCREIAFWLERLPKFHIPSSLVVGFAQDRICPMTMQRKIAVKYGAEFVPFQFGHMAPIEEGNEFLLLWILNWLRDKVA